MYSKIIQMRLRGAVRQDRDVSNDPGVMGVIEMVKCAGYLRMQVRQHGNYLPEGVLLPSLWDATCTGWCGPMMTWQGYQQFQLPEKKGNPVYFQEWRVELIGDQPPDHLIKGLYDTYNRPEEYRPLIADGSAR